MGRRHLELLLAAARNLARNGAAHAVAASGLVAGLTLLLAGLAIGEGVKAEALAGVEAGADVYCAWDVFGREAPMPRERVEELAAIPGVVHAVPRIVGRVDLSDEVALLVGVPLGELRRRAADLELEGALPASEEELLVGRELARAADLRVGGTIALDASSIRLFRVAGIIGSSASLWSAKAIVCDLEEAAAVFGERERVSDVCLDTRPGYADLVAEAATRLDRRYRVQTRELVETYVFRGITLREGLFTVLFALALALAVPAFAILTYLGHTPRRREIGLLKAEGWSTADVLQMVACENLLVSVLVAGGSLALAFAWVRLGAPGIASFFLAELPLFPEMRIPARFLPLPALLALAFSLAVTMTGSLPATWRTASARPAEVLR